MKIKHCILIIITVGFAIYFLSLFGSFLWDDEEQVVNNTLAHSISNIPELFTGSTFNTGGAGGLSGIYYKPLMSVCFALLYILFGPNAFFFHLLQLVLHICNSILLFLLFERFFRNRRIRTLRLGSTRFDFAHHKSLTTSRSGQADINRWLSFGLALLFLVHPINIEAVAYISALQDALFLFFGLLALLVVIREKELSKPLEKIRLSPYLLAGLLLLLSLLSKETGFIFVIIVCLYLFMFKNKKKLRDYVYLFISLFIYCALRFAVAGVGLSKGGISPIMRVSFGERLLNIPLIILFYLKTFLYPDKLAIAQHWLIKEPSFGQFFLPLILILLFFGALAIFGYLLFRRKSPNFKLFIFFFLWFVFGLGLHLQIVPLDMTVAERWFYLPVAGLLGVIAVIMMELVTSGWINEKRFEYLKFVGLAILFFLSFRTFNRTLDWANGLTLFTHDASINPEAFDLENNLGVELFRKGEIDEAKIHFEKSTKLAPYWWTNWNNFGAVYDHYGDFTKAEEYYKKALNNGDYYLAYENYTLILIKQEKFNDAKAFLETEALLKFPYNERLNAAYLYILSL